MDVRVIPEEARRMVDGDQVFVIESLAIRDMDEDVVAVAARRHVQPVDVQIGLLPAEMVDQADAKPAAGFHPQGRAGDAPLVAHLAQPGRKVRQRLERGFQQAIAARAHRRFGEAGPPHRGTRQRDWRGVERDRSRPLRQRRSVP